MIGIIIITILSLIIGVILVYLDYKLDDTTKFVEGLLEHLPGYNCGSCGYGGCQGMAEAIENDTLNYTKCRLLKDNLLKEMEMYLKKEKKF